MTDRILVVEDDEGIRILLGRYLRAAGLEAVSFADAESAWHAAQVESFDIAIIDWNLPGMSGGKLCQYLRSDSEYDACVIVVITGSSDPKILDAALTAGADDYLSKPLEPNTIAIRMKIARQRVLEKKHRMDAEHQFSEYVSILQKKLDNAASQVVRTQESLNDKAKAYLQAVDRLHESEALYRSVAELSGDGIGIVQDQQFVFVNSQLAEMLGRPVNNVIGMPCHRCLSSASMACEVVANMEEPAYLQGRLYRADDEQVPVDIATQQLEYQGRTGRILVVRPQQSSVDLM